MTTTNDLVATKDLVLISDPAQMKLVRSLLEMHGEVGDDVDNALARLMIETGPLAPANATMTAEALRQAENALAQGQENVTGTDDTSAAGASDSMWCEPLVLVRNLMTAHGVERICP